MILNTFTINFEVVDMKKYRLTFFVILFLSCLNGYSQSCKIEFYLLKQPVVSIDKDTQLVTEFHVSKDDLFDSPFISNEEVLGFSVKTDKMKKGKKRERHIFHVPDSVTKRINDLQIPLCCGMQFALLADD